MLTFSWGYYSFLDIYTVLTHGSHPAKPGFLRFLFIAAVPSHYLPPPKRLNTTAFKSRPKTIPLEKRVYNLKNDGLLMCFVLLTQKWFLTIRVSLYSMQNLIHDDRGVDTQKPSKLRAISENVCPWFWLTVHVTEMGGWIIPFISSKAKLWRQCFPGCLTKSPWLSLLGQSYKPPKHCWI